MFAKVFNLQRVYFKNEMQGIQEEKVEVEPIILAELQAELMLSKI